MRIASPVERKHEGLVNAALRLSWIAGIGILAAWPDVALADPPLITEFSAGKQRVLLDEDNEYPDWIEIYNPGPDPVNLLDYSLTNDETQPGLWRFPDKTLEPRKFLVVFASGKDRRDPAKNLHTNFTLQREGQLLAFLAADGFSVLSYFPLYPTQQPRVSYGARINSTESLLVSAGAAAKVFIPADASLAQTWTARDFDDAAWTGGVTGIGFDNKSTATFTEVIAFNVNSIMSGVNSTAFIRVPFTVANPTAFGALYLRVKYDDGFIAYLNGREVARRGTPTPVAAPWNARAAVRRVDAAAIVFEEIAISDGLSALVQGQNILAIHGLNNTRTDPDFLIVPELAAATIDSIDPGTELFFPASSPGGPNAGGFGAVAESPTFSRIGGGFTENFDLALASPTPGEIRYTLDRTEPTEASTLYAGPILVDRTLMVRARTFAPNHVASPTASETFIAMDNTAATFTSNLPIVVIEAFGKVIPEGTFLTTQAAVIDTRSGRSAMTGDPMYFGPAALKIRGSSSLGFPKKSFNFELDDYDGDDSAAPLLGMPEESDWILYAPYTDKTLIRDVISYDWSNDIGQWASHSRMVEVFIHSSAGKMSFNSHYQGVYALIEKIKRDPNRVNIQKLYRSHDKEPEISGGYILKKDRLDPGDAGINTGRHTLGLVEPKEEEITPVQKAWILNYLRQFETVLYGGSWLDPVNGYRKFIDVESFIDHHIMVEVTKNIDGYRLSTYMHKDRGGKLVMGPVWDYNLTLGNANYLDGWKPDGWYYALVGDGDYPWYRRIQQDPAFQAAYADRWVELRGTHFELSRLLGRVQDYVDVLQESQVRNFRKWNILGIYVWPNQFIGRTYADEIGFMTDWITDRVAWMDGALIPPPTFSNPGGDVPADLQLEITAKAGTVYYTKDGSDPRRADGELSPTAIEYSGPIGFPENTRIRARARVDGAVWTGLKEGVFVVKPATLAVTEVHYAPLAPPAPPFAADDFEFIELQNTGSAPLDLAGFRFSKGVTWNFADGPVLPPGGYLVVSKNAAALATRYDLTGVTIAAPFVGNLSNAAEFIATQGKIGEVIQDFRYQGTWYPEIGAQGYSLVIRDPLGPKSNWGIKEGWRPSSAVGGSPGKADPDVVPGGLQLPGDISQDGQLNITDAVNILGHLALGAPAALPCEGGTVFDPGNLALLDADGDGAVALTDAILMLNYLFLDGTEHFLGSSCVRITGCPDACTP